LFSTVPPSFPVQTLPTNKQRKIEDESVSLSCTSEVNIPPYSISSQILPIPGSELLRTVGQLAIGKLSWKLTGTFSCIAINDAGKAMQSTELEVPCKYQ